MKKNTASSELFKIE